MREGTCGRCAACCKILFKCPFLDESSPIATCSIHDRRPDNCRFFPIDPRDLADRDLIDPINPCGFSFPDAARADANGTLTPAPPSMARAAHHAPLAGHPGLSAMSDTDPFETGRSSSRSSQGS